MKAVMFQAEGQHLLSNFYVPDPVLDTANSDEQDR